jgi:hypothetical protein
MDSSFLIMVLQICKRRNIFFRVFFWLHAVWSIHACMHASFASASDLLQLTLWWWQQRVPGSTTHTRTIFDLPRIIINLPSKHIKVDKFCQNFSMQNFFWQLNQLWFQVQNLQLKMPNARTSNAEGDWLKLIKVSVTENLEQTLFCMGMSSWLPGIMFLQPRWCSCNQI